MAGFLETYCTGAGSNLNSGSTTGNSATYTGVGDSDGSATFTPSDGSTPASSVNVGDMASIFVTAGATVSTFIGRITAVAAGVNGAITVSTTAKVGTIPANSAGAHTITCKVGGAWAGPAGAVIFPVGFIAGTLTDASGNTPRVNYLSSFAFAPTAVMAHTLAGPVQFEGYTTTPGDGGRVTFDGADPGVSFNLLTNSGANNTFENLIFQKNGSTGTGTAAGVVNSGTGCAFRRCTFNTTRGAGLTLGGALALECEFYGCNVANTASVGGLTLNSAGGVARRCYSRSNAGSNNAGFAMTSSGGALEHCVADGNQLGANLTGAGPYNLVHLDTYANTSHGVQVGNANTNVVVHVENGSHCNNGGWGMAGVGTGTKSGWVANVAFGSGTAANTSGQTTGLGAVKQGGAITLATNVTPWSAPATGDFRVTLPALVGAGLGTFTQTSPKSGTTGQPTVGAAGQAIALVPPTAAQVATAVWTDLLASSDFSTAGSAGAIIKAGNAPTAAQVATAVWTDLLASADFATAGSAGAKLLALAVLASGRVDVGAWLGAAVQLDTNNLPKVDTEDLAGLPVTPGDPLANLVPGAYNSGTAGAALGRIGVGQITVVSPVSQSGNVALVQGDDYAAADGASLDWSAAAGVWPDLTGATAPTVTVFVPGSNYTRAGSVVTAGGSVTQKVRWEPSSADSAALPSGSFTFRFEVTLASGRKRELARGTLTCTAA